jgi:YidC/Oxa1 family membrane protein insertase
MKREDLLNLVLAVGLSLAVVAVWSHFYGKPRPAPPPVTAPAPQEDAATVSPAPPTAATAAPTAAATPGTGVTPPAEQVAGDEGRVETIETPEVRLVVSARGGRVLEWRLLRYPRLPGRPDSGAVDLVSDEAAQLNRHPLVLLTGDAALDASINEAPTLIETGAPDAAEQQAKELPDGTRRVRFRWADRGIVLEKTLYLFGGDDYLGRFEWSLTRDGKPVPASVWWGPSIGRGLEQNTSQYSYRGHVSVPAGNGVTEFTAEKQEADVVFGAGAVPRWLVLNDQYFAIALMPDEATAAAIKLVNPGPNATLAVTVTTNRLTLYAGPKATSVLTRVDRRLGTTLQSIVPWGWFGFIAKPLYQLLAYVQGRVGNWGLAIILVTIAIRLAFVPLTQRSMVKMRQAQQQMAKVQPKLHKLREKYKDKRDMESRRKMNEETMELYKREGINPMAQLSGCLPLLLQLPVLFAMFKTLTVATELRGAPFFGWIRDLSAMDPYYVLPIVMGATQLIQQMMTMTKTEDPQARSQQRIMLIMPVMFIFFFYRMPSGLVLYWLVQNLVGIAQQVFINKHAATPSPARAS